MFKLVLLEKLCNVTCSKPARYRSRPAFFWQKNIKINEKEKENVRTINAVLFFIGLVCAKIFNS
jgi:hypothetical protein